MQPLRVPSTGLHGLGLVYSDGVRLAQDVERGSAMARQSKSSVDESTLTKGQLRKLNALRKSVGPEIAERAFAEWLANQPVIAAAAAASTAERIAEHLYALVDKENLNFPRGGYIVRRGRGRIVVEPAKTD